jgi:hypothetical protein
MIHLLAATDSGTAGALAFTPPAVPMPDLTLYRWVLIAHSLWRWVVLIAGFGTLLQAVVQLIERRPWVPVGARLARFFGVAVDIQVLMGAALYLILSPLTTMMRMGAMRLPHKSQAYFFVVLHPSIMIVGFIAVHIAAVLVRRARSDAGHQRRAIIFYGITLLILLYGIPWWRPWLRG